MSLLKIKFDNLIINNKNPLKNIYIVLFNYYFKQRFQKLQNNAML